MSRILYPNFLNDPVEYRQAESLWRDRWNSLVHQVGQERIWQSPWLTTAYGNGEPFRDGNPIFSAICPTRRCGVRVIQREPSDNPDEVNFWEGTFAKGDEQETREVVVTCVLTDEAIHRAFEVLERCITEEQSGRLST